MKTCPRCGYESGLNGAVIRALRKSRRMTLAQVAAKLGITVPYLHDIEHDRRGGARHREAIATLFGVHPSELDR